MRFFGALDTAATLPNRTALDPRVDDRGSRTCRTIGQFAVYMHDFGLDKFDARFRDDAACWNGTAAACVPAVAPRDRGYTWWCNRRPNNPCVYGCPHQVDECNQQTNPRPRYVRFDGANPTDPALSSPVARWANASSRGWPSAWTLDRNNAQGNIAHVQAYAFGDGWATSLVTNVSAETGNALDYWAQGRARVTYGTSAIPQASSFTLPSGAANATHLYWMGTGGNPPFRQDQSTAVATTHGVYGGFTVAVTHESRSQTVAACYVDNAAWSPAANGGRGGFANETCAAAGSYALTSCPFTFRCFTAEANAGAPGPRCMPSLPGDYDAATFSGPGAPPPPPAWVGACGEYCPGCPTCPMLRCWRTAPVDTPDTAYTDLDAPYDATKLQDDRIPYIRVRHYDEALVERDRAAGTEQTALAWHANSWRLNACGSHTNTSAGGLRTVGMAMRGDANHGPYLSTMRWSVDSRNLATHGPSEPRCAPYPRNAHTAGGYVDAYTLPALFPAPPLAKLTDTLVWIPELEELSFTDVALVDHREWRTAAQLGAVTGAGAYAALRASAGEPAPQSLNDFAGSCGRLEAAGTLAAYGMTRAACDARAADFGRSVRIIRANATASQVPPMAGALHDEDWGALAAQATSAPPQDVGPAGTAYADRVNYWHSMVQGTLPPEWGNFFPNVEAM
jgi:hypothetical protein